MKTLQITPGQWQPGLDLPQVANNNPDPRLVWSGSMLIIDCRSKWISPEEAAANAKAIAAVPELIDAATAAQCDCLPRERESGHRSGCWFPALEAALKKAGAL